MNLPKPNKVLYSMVEFVQHFMLLSASISCRSLLLKLQHATFRSTRDELSEWAWQLVEPHRRSRLGNGRDNRQFVNAVFYRVCLAWPARTIWAVEHGGASSVLVDSTAVKAHSSSRWTPTATKLVSTGPFTRGLLISPWCSTPISLA